jgi:citrate lyase subunit beta / citryl-CoA lyase
MSRPTKSYLFVPGDRPDRFDKAAQSGADQIILDLEDAVAPAAKAEARQAVREWGSTATMPVVIRVNAGDTPWFADDLTMAAALPSCEVMVPKSDPDVLQAAFERTGRPLIALIETVAGVMTLRRSASLPGVARIAFGNLDFGVDSGMSDEASELDSVRTRINLESRFAGLQPPVDGVTVALTDADQLDRDLARAKRLGFGAKLCIHPRQVAAANAAFQPSEAEIAWAHRVLDAAAAAAGAAVALDGKMVDRPVLQRAKMILALPR